MRIKKKKINKDIRKSITNSWGRFVSIMFLMLLGSLALVGLYVTGPDMRQTGINYFNQYNTADITISGDYGIDTSEQEQIEKANGIKEVEYIYLKDVTIKNSNDSIRVFSTPKIISKYELTEGKLPNLDDEIAISDTYKEKYNIGDTIEFTEKAINDTKTLKKHKFKIVGFVKSSEILSSLNLGQTTVGTGELNGYAIINEENFNSDVYMMAKLRFEDTENLNPYSDEYNEKINEHKNEIEKLLKEQQETRLADIKSEYQTKIDDGQKELDDAKKELEDARIELANANTQIENAKTEILESENKLNDAKNQINSSETEINKKWEELNTKQKEYENSLNEYNAKKEELKKAETTIISSQAELDSKKTQLENAKTQYENGITSLNAGIAECENILQDPNLSDVQRQVIEQKKTEYGLQLEETQTAYNNFMGNTYNLGVDSINEAQKILDIRKEEYNSGKQQLEKASTQLQSAKGQLDNGKTSLDSAKSQLKTAKQEYNFNKTKLDKAKTDVQEKEQEYNEKLREFQEKEPDAISEINENEEKLNDSRKALDELSLPTYSVDNRRELPSGEGYEIYETVSEIVDSLAKVFPVFLYLVASLVTLTTMTRFVGDERINNGTLKSLGYSDNDVIKKFTIYGFIAGMTGTIIGIILGHTIIPIIVYSAYKDGFTLPKIELHFYAGITITAVVLSLISSVLPARIIATKELKENTATLLQPKAPKAGSKILLERIKPIWSKMKFTHKVTARNIFRYKKRMFMTIFGVAGAASILFAGFSVQYSISGINERQFNNIIKYDAIVALNDDLTDAEQDELNELINDEAVDSYTSVFYEEVSKTAGKNNDKQSIKLIVPQDTEEFSKYISILNRKTGQNMQLEDDSVIISERLANLLNVKTGDFITYTDSNGKLREVKISGVCEMYAGHFIFMNKEEYKNIYGEDLQINAKLLLFKESTIENTQSQSAKFMELSAVKGVVQNTTLYNQIDTIVKSLNKIMLVLIILAVLLAIVILYNLTNINVAERIRELCTIKVLGFYDNETTMYIYRETIILSAIGIVVGWIIGIILHAYILNVVPPNEVMFNPIVWVGAYIIPLVSILVVSFVLKYYVNGNLKTVDMLEALKSVD